MAFVQDDDDVIGSINITPFVDIILVVLIIFMVTSSAIAKAAFEVDLPTAASAGESVGETLNIVVTKDGTLKLNGEETTPEALGAFIRAESSDQPTLQAVIAADKHVDYGVVIGVIDLLKIHGVTRFALNIERRASPS